MQRIYDNDDDDGYHDNDDDTKIERPARTPARNTHLFILSIHPVSASFPDACTAGILVSILLYLCLYVPDST